jgi:ABC-type transport system involved in cytochrome c biogenesis ATPase subunit
MAGITKPTRGHLSVEGRISALIELGAGFHPEISGRENVAINGIMLGLTRREVDERFEEIVDFAELRPFIDAPVKTYSSGMYARLGFAVAVHVDPDVLLIDEVLAVGDEAFTRKCLDKIGEFRRRGKTILIVTHSLGLGGEDVRRRALAAGRGRWRPGRSQTRGRRLSHLCGGGRREAPGQGSGGDGVDRRSAARRRTRGADRARRVIAKGRWGSREVEITRVRLLDDRGDERHVYVPGERLTIALEVEARARWRLRVRPGTLHHGWRCRSTAPTPTSKTTCPGRRKGRGEVRLVLQDLRLVEGTYLLDLAAHRRDGTPYDYHRGLYSSA